MDVLAIVKKNKTFLKERFGVEKIGVFGSMVRGEANEDSDVDVLVEFENTKKSFDNFMELSFFLEDLFAKKVDLITTSGLDKYVRSYVEREVVGVKSDEVFIKHILDEIGFLKTHSRNLELEDLMKNEILKRAFPRSIEIIGEAAKNISDPLKEKYPDIEWKKLQV